MRKEDRTAQTDVAYYEENGFPTRLQKEVATALKALGRKSTEQTFETGEILENAATTVPDKILKKWLSEHFGMTDRSARSYRAVFRNLGPVKKELIELGVGTTVLGRLSSASSEQIEEAIEFAKEHGRLRVSDVNAILKGDEDETNDDQADPFDVGGTAGLKGLIALKTREGQKSFLSNCVYIQASVMEALSGKRVIKKELVQKIELTARLAHRELENLVLFVMPSPNSADFIYPTPIPSKTHWKTVLETLRQMGGQDSWPKAEELRDWLEFEVLPALRWATSEDKNPEWSLNASKTDAKKVETEVPVAEPAANSEAAIKRFAPIVEKLNQLDIPPATKTASPKRAELKTPPLASDELEVPAENAPAM